MSPIYKESHSQAGQESFALTVLEEKTDGYYLELGSAWPVKNSNTYILETKYRWQGLSLENDPERVQLFNQSDRANKCVDADATTFNYLKYFEENNFPNQIDYLQMDLHPASVTLEALKVLPLEKYRFSTITYEHNGYIDEKHQKIKKVSQEILLSLGYFLVVSDVTLNYNGRALAYEDWYVDPSVISKEKYFHLINKSILWDSIF
jgi:hypothetical protein